MILLVLLHKGRGGGLSDMFGGGVSSSLGGSSVAERNLDRLTIGIGVIWFACVVALGLLLAYQGMSPEHSKESSVAGGGNAIRGSRVGAGPMGEAERGEAAPRQAVTYFCSHDHRSVVTFAIEAAVPESWDCPKCGLPASLDSENPPPAPKIEPYKTHLAYVKERRSDDRGGRHPRRGPRSCSAAAASPATSSSDPVRVESARSEPSGASSRRAS